MSARTRDARIAGAVEAWFRAHARPLPWRTEPREPYLALVSEAMLLQTQASRVAERFPRFVARFPTVVSLAAADERDVLAEWSGLGYYRRARLLHAAARAVVNDHAGRVPSDAGALRSLPGVGRYSAGSIASIAFGAREPIVDGNVARVLLRVEGRPAEHGSRVAMVWAWERATALVRRATSPAALNEGLMELGAITCTPRAPACGGCPLRRLCSARRAGTQGSIPSPKRRSVRVRLHVACVVSRDARGRTLVERRDGPGLWAGLWQPPSVESRARAPTRAAVARLVGLPPAALVRAQAFEFLTTHRAVRFIVWSAEGAPPLARPARGRWRTIAQSARLPLASPHRRILRGESNGAGGPRRRARAAPAKPRPARARPA